MDRGTPGLPADPLAPLALPGSDGLADVAAAPSTALFVARATARDPAFRLTAESAPAIAQVCCRVDGLPLAIEFAAARASVLSPREIAGRLGDLMTGLGAGPRDARAPADAARHARLGSGG